ncbi:MAG TPA: hypothetical protein IAB48_06725 [Candidatus Fimimorpha excrementavium]|nr:hypothetical protein [Candidatus Fimimorpha excrementavium]
MNYLRTKWIPGRPQGSKPSSIGALSLIENIAVHKIFLRRIRLEKSSTDVF